MVIKLAEENGMKFTLKESQEKETINYIPVIDKLDFINKRRNNMPGISNIQEFIDVLNAVGKNKFMVKETKCGRNLSLGDLKDEWYTLKKYGWKWYIKNIPEEFVTYYVFEKIPVGENFKIKTSTSNKNVVKESLNININENNNVIELHCNCSSNSSLNNISSKELQTAFYHLLEDINCTKPVEVKVTTDMEESVDITEDMETNYLNDLYEYLIQAQICIDKIKEDYPKNVYDVIDFGIKSCLDEFMEHDETGYTIYGAIKEWKDFKNARLKESIDNDDNYYDDDYQEEDSTNYPKNLPEQFRPLFDKLNGEFWTRKDELKQDIEEIDDIEYTVDELNDEYVVVTDPEDDMHGLQIFNGGTARTYVLDFSRIRYI